MDIPTHFCVREAHYFFARAHSLEEHCMGALYFKVASQAGRWFILVARLDNTIAPGRRASDFASTAVCGNNVRLKVLK